MVCYSSLKSSSFSLLILHFYGIREFQYLPYIYWDRRGLLSFLLRKHYSTALGIILLLPMKQPENLPLSDQKVSCGILNITKSVFGSGTGIASCLFIYSLSIQGHYRTLAEFTF